MKLKFIFGLILVCAGVGVAQNRQNVVKTSTKSMVAVPNLLPIRRVVLYSSGVAYIERRGTVTGKAEINLPFKHSQIDDVLKSMIVLDLGKGRINAVSYNASAPPSARMSEIPFSVAAAENEDEKSGFAAVLAQLQGAKVAVSAANKIAVGSILTVETRQTAGEKNPATSQFLVVAGADGEIVNFNLADVRSIKLLEDDTKQDLNEFTSAAASARRRDAKTITIDSDGAGAREIVVSYVVAAPIWKTTYRVVVGDDGKPFFQGWAIVDNVSEDDWQNVRLSLVSGSPVSFIQPLQNPLFRHRPVIEIPESLSLEPQIYRDNMPLKLGNANSDAVSGDIRYGSGSGNGVNGGIGRSEESVTTTVSDALTNENAGIETAAIGAKLGDSFEYRMTEAVSVARNRSALIPIVQTKMDGERVSIFRENEDDENPNKARPMSGILLKNTSPLTFEGGAMTILERDAYAGEALMERLKSGENRLISFALDLETLVNVKQIEDREPAKLIKAGNGNFQIHYFKTNKKTYTLQNQSDRARTIYVEHPIAEKWSLSDDTLKPAETTAEHYRFRIELKPFEVVTLPVTEKQALMDSYILRNLSQSDLEIFVFQRVINDATRAKLQKLIDLRSQVNQISEKLKNLDAEETSIGADQARFRENIESLTNTPEAKTLIARYIAKANEQETRLEQITRERQTLNTERTRLEADLAAEIKNFTL